MSTRKIVVAVVMLFCSLSQAQLANPRFPVIDMKKMLDESTLGAEILQDWHEVRGACPTRQKLVTIRVGELWPGQDYRIPVRMIVPADRKAKGFHLTGGHNMDSIKKDAQPRGVDEELVRGGVGLVYTIVQEPKTFGAGKLAGEMRARFIKTLDPHFCIQYWAWPATLMRATTMAFSQKDHFEKGKVAMSGGSKNGATPSSALIYDNRLTAVHAAISPIWDSPLRLCDHKAWDKLEAFNEAYAGKISVANARKKAMLLRHPFLGGTFGPIYNRQALEAGHSWEELRKLALRVADYSFITRRLDDLRARGVAMYFHPGTHDFVAYDMAWGGEHHPSIPIYLKANSGHGQCPHKAAERDEQNKSAFLLHHFFRDVGTMLDPPSVRHEVKAGKLRVTIQFKAGSKAESGRIWWMYDRGPDGSIAYIREMIPDDQWKDMSPDASKDIWTAEIDLKPGVSHIDFFSNHRKTLEYKSKKYPTYISCPYTRVMLR